MTRWNLSIPTETDRVVRMFLAEQGTKKGDLSQFVDRAVRQAILHETVKELKEHNADRDQEELMAVVDEAVDWTRANCP